MHILKQFAKSNHKELALWRKKLKMYPVKGKREGGRGKGKTGFNLPSVLCLLEKGDRKGEGIMVKPTRLIFGEADLPFPLLSSPFTFCEINLTGRRFLLQ
jgi:hypothetical protein